MPKTNIIDSFDETPANIIAGLVIEDVPVAASRQNTNPYATVANQLQIGQSFFVADTDKAGSAKILAALRRGRANNTIKFAGVVEGTGYRFGRTA